MALTPQTAPDRLPGLVLWFEQAAREWVEALPLGNGRLGAMVYGRVDEEIIGLNDDTLYSGEPKSRDLPLDITKDYDRVVALLRGGQYAEADHFITRHWLGRGQNSYQPLGQLRIKFDDRSEPTAYRRELDLARAVATTTYTQNGVTFTREQFASHPDGVLVIRFHANKADALNFTLRFDSPHPTARCEATDAGDLTLRGRVPYLVVRRELGWLESSGDQWKYPELFNADRSRRALPELPRRDEQPQSVGDGGTPVPVLYSDGADGPGTRFAAQLRVRTDRGTVRAEQGLLRVSGATDVVIVLAVGSSFKTFDRPPGHDQSDADTQAAVALDKIANRSYATLLERHVADYRALFDRVSIDLGPPTAKSQEATDRRVANYAKGGDESLVALYFQFGRYLMIAGSRPGSQPLNLQGIWNDMVVPPWASGYTTNINVEMNYWPAEVTNLADCHEPLFKMIEALAVTGQRTADQLFKRPGWVCFHNTDIWRDSQPVDNIARTAWWPMAGGWLCEHLWEHFQFSGDEQFLRERAYPLMKGAAEFLLTWLVEDEKGRLVTPAGTSPENGFFYLDATGHKRNASVCMGPTMDMAIIRELFTNCSQATQILHTDESFRVQLQAALAKLLPYQVGARGQLQEWPTDFEEDQPTHRHVSHLYGLYPSNQITSRGTPELFAAARRTLDLRGDNGTGWSLGWKISFQARMDDGDHAHELLRLMLTPKRTYPNLFDSCPPFQIDGNFGVTAGVAEMLLQSQNDELHLLPALPKAWPDGSVNGLRARGGFEVDLAWRGGGLTRCVVRSALGRPLVIRYGDHIAKFSLAAANALQLNGDLEQINAK